MKREKHLLALVVIGYYAALAGAVVFGGLRAGVMAMLASCCAAAGTRLLNTDVCDDADDNSCAGCRHDLGGGMCDVNLEDECREGGGFEAKEEA